MNQHHANPRHIGDHFPEYRQAFDALREHDTASRGPDGRITETDRATGYTAATALIAAIDADRNALTAEQRRLRDTRTAPVADTQAYFATMHRELDSIRERAVAVVHRYAP